ncbi:hypothetical protein PFISCL1PPCAC_27371 [Pristionchus fissidentatus]|uniref:Uncharacterized protein n=1 Tax=Pristionchus fissidentatus TaxID=1538716 RepID=A0AAV5WZH0_9BILA|nr:hypothetical protein PFISCL1PPCAC_27371 [Pristionchus fissidentatus]
MRALLLPILFLIPTSVAQHSRAFPGPLNSVEIPQCPNGESPKLDKHGGLIQCLPGAGQHSVCGPVHTCFFSGVNYMCCPTNEPPADAPPVCPNGLLTVTDARNHVVRCIPGRKACPAGGQLCLHTGREREHVCCKKLLARPSTPKPTHPIDSGDDEIVSNLCRVSCPAKSLSVLNASGNSIACSASAPCPGANHICFGTTKRAICCQEQPQKHISLGAAMVDHTSGHASDAAEKAVKETVREGLKRKQIKESGKVDKRQEFLDAVQPSSPVQPLSTMNDGEMTQKPVRRLKKVRKTTATSTTSTTTSTAEEYEYYYVDENGKEETSEVPTTTTTTTTTTTEEPTTTRKIRRSDMMTIYLLPRRKIKTTTSAPTEGDVEDVVAVDEGNEEKAEKSFESGETLYKNRPRAQEIDANVITEPQFARPRAKAAKTLTGPIQPNHEQRKEMAQKHIMRHIRNGWPYNENYYRPEVTDAPESPIFVQ